MSSETSETVFLAFLDLLHRNRLLLRGAPERLQGRRDGAGERDVGAEPAQRVGGEERVGADVDHLGFGLGLAFLRDPRHVALDDQHDVGFLEQRVRVPAAMHRVLGGEREMARPVVHHGDRQHLRELLDRARGLLRAPAARRDEQRVLRRAEELRRLFQRLGIGRGRGGGSDRGSLRKSSRGEVGSQNLPWQRHVYRSLRLALGDGERAVDHRLHLLGVAQLVVPLHELAQHAALVEVLLRPVDVVVARAKERRAARGGSMSFGDRRAPGGEQDRHVLARGVDQPVERVRGADADVHHHRLRPPGHHGVAVRHGDAHVLVRHDHDLRQAPAELLPLGVGLDQRREVGAAVGEEVLDAARREQAEPGVRGGFGLKGDGMVRFHRRDGTCATAPLPGPKRGLSKSV